MMEADNSPCRVNRAAQYRVAQATEVTLPSGATFKLRRPGAKRLIEWNVLPTALLARGGGRIDPATLEDQDMVAMAKVLCDCLTYCCVEPRIVPADEGARAPSDDELSPDEVSMEDTLFIFHYAMRGPEAAALEPFRQRRVDAAAGGDGEGIQPAAVATSGA